MDDNSFRPRLRGQFDLTLKFEHIIFYLVPSCIVVFMTGLYVKRALSLRERLVRPGALLWIKSAVALALVGVQVANAVLWGKSALSTQVAVAAAAMSAVSAVCVAILTFAGHIYYLRSLSFLGFYLSLSIVLDVAATLTYFNRTGLETIARLHIAVPCLKAALVVLEELPKRSLFRSEALRSQSISQEVMAGFWNRSVMVWANFLLLHGYRGEINQSSMPSLGPDYDSEVLHEAFMHQWESRSKSAKHALMMACLRTVPWSFVYIILPRLLSIGFDFAQPFLLQSVVNEVSHEAPPAKNIMRGLILATVIVYSCRAMAKTWYSVMRNQISVSIRAILISAVYHKSLRLSAEQLEKSAAVTLVTADVSGVASLVSLSYDTWGRGIEVGLGVAVLGIYAGAATIFTAIPVIGTTVASVYVGRRLMTTRTAWNENIETRVATTSNVLAQIKEAKMLGLTPILSQRIQKQFEREVELVMISRKYYAMTMGISAIAELLTPVLVVAAIIFWTRASEPITASRIFTTLALVALVTNPLYFLIHSVGSWGGGFACLKRLQDYLNLPETEDPREFAIQEESTVNEKSALGTVYPAPSAPGAEDTKIISAASSGFAVQFDQVSFVADTISILRDISLKIKTGDRAAFFGPVGCGKSTVLRSILGEARPTSGKVILATRSVAYCSQVPWVQNDTIQNNILGGKPYNETLYNKVVYACALDSDIARLPEKDQTQAGSEGGNLSGGQKQRVSLARTLYDEAEILILDDVFSALDAKTSATIRARLFSEGDLLSAGKTTVIMATSMRSHLVHADVSYEMQSGGTAALSLEHEKERELARERQQLSDNSTASEVDSASEYTKERDSDWDTPEVTPLQTDALRDSLTTLKYGDLTIYKYFLRPAGLVNVVFWLATVGTASVIDRIPPIFARIWMERNPHSHFYFIGFAVLSAMAPVLYFCAPFIYYRFVITKCAPVLHRTLLYAASFATFEFLAGEDAGTLLNRFTQDIQMATQQLPVAITPVVWGMYSLIIDVGVISAGATYALPIIPFFFAVVFLIQHFYLRTSRQVRLVELDSSKSLLRHLTESGTGVEYIRAFKWQEKFTVQLHRVLDQTQKPYYYLQAIQQWLTVVMDFITAGSAVVVVSLALNYKGASSASAVGLSLLTLVSFSDFTGATVRWFVVMENMFGAVARIREFAKSTPQESDDGTSSLPERWSAAGKVEFCSISASYKSDTEKPHQALDNVSLTIQPGQTVGLVGRTGSGKSSMLLVLLRLLEYSGNIYIDGRELRTIPRNELRSRITTITQAGLALKASVRFNMNPFAETEDSSADERMIEILQRVGLWEHIEKRGGLEALMGTMKFSVGERQLFQMARAILHKENTGSSLFLMDEGTSSIDEATEKRIYGLTKESFAGCTKIIISHREGVLADTDVVLNMSDGRGELGAPAKREVVESKVEEISANS
ncbi:hypothetical protein NLG97_g1716 [Lecanicillium saksenae]|uniref:Uncharacterized protein n=1 Tax=Lecanicillium saksenae TaxID=468837 RepID=A0ACC1R481_9HYPO|nr:hypothetical protein NLG97_g1716 [Lecanicillium saksenae]